MNDANRHENRDVRHEKNSEFVPQNARPISLYIGTGPLGGEVMAAGKTTSSTSLSAKIARAKATNVSSCFTRSDNPIRMLEGQVFKVLAPNHGHTKQKNRKNERKHPSCVRL